MGIAAHHQTRRAITGSALVAAALVAASAAQAGGECNCPKNHVVRVPGVSVSGPTVSVSTPSVFINKGGIAVRNSFTGGGGFVFGGGSTLGSSIISSGGGGFSLPARPPTVITNLNVDAGAESSATAKSKTITKTRWVEDVYVLRAVCIDPKGIPHPASRPDPAEHVPENFDGELFRCMAGTSMQVTLGRYVDGHGRYDHASTMVCARGEALRHRFGGQLVCAPQEPRRNCNERSLLRKYGPGVKIVRLRHQERYSEQVSSAQSSASASASASAGSTLVLSGGVGN